MSCNLKIVVSICLLSTVFGGGWLKDSFKDVKEKVSATRKVPPGSQNKIFTPVQLLSKFASLPKFDSCSKYGSLTSPLQNVSLGKDFETFFPRLKLPMMKNSPKFYDAESGFEKFCSALSSFTYAGGSNTKSLQFGKSGVEIGETFSLNYFNLESDGLFFDFPKVLHSFNYYSSTFFLSKLQFEDRSKVFKMQYELKPKKEFSSLSNLVETSTGRKFVIEYEQGSEYVTAAIPGLLGGVTHDRRLTSYKNELERIKTKITNKIFINERTMPFLLAKKRAAKIAQIQNNYSARKALLKLKQEPKGKILPIENSAQNLRLASAHEI